MTRISELNFFPNFSPEKEFFKLRRFLCDKSAFKSSGYYDYSDYSIFDLLAYFFDKWKLRGSFTSLEEMMYSLKLNDTSGSVSEDKLLDYVQFILNVLFFLTTIKINPFYFESFNSIHDSTVQHCALLLKKLNAEAKKIDDEIVVSYKNDVATVVSSQQPELAPSIAEYLAINNRDDLQRKAEVLCSLAKALEPQKQRLDDNGFQQLRSDATFLLNKTGIRHALDPNDDIEAQFLAMDDSERIKWYDRAFKTVLACMAVLPYLEFRDEIKEIKRN